VTEKVRRGTQTEADARTLGFTSSASSAFFWAGRWARLSPATSDIQQTPIYAESLTSSQPIDLTSYLLEDQYWERIKLPKEQPRRSFSPHSPVPPPEKPPFNLHTPGVVYTKPWTVELMLDLSGYTADRPLAEMVALEPSAGDGAFLVAMARRYVESCRRHRQPLMTGIDAIRAFEIDPEATHLARQAIIRELEELRVPTSTAIRLADSWVKCEDFLEGALAFPIADFVLGNPPYVRSEEILEKKAKSYRNAFKTMVGRADLYIAFFEAALMQLKSTGVCTYICADRWLLNDYGRALRHYITTQGFDVRYIIEAHDVDAFAAEVSAYPAITLIGRGVQGSVTVAKALKGIEAHPTGQVIADLKVANSSAVLRAGKFTEWFRGEDPWPCSSPDRLRVLKQLEKACPLLEDKSTRTKVGIGVASGADDVFVVPGPVDVEPDCLLPLALADDLNGSRVEWSGHYLLNPWKEEGLIDLSRYPKLDACLSRSKEALSSRHTAIKQPEKWHKTIDRVNLSLLGRPKLYVADIKDRLLPALDEGLTYPHHNLYWITSDVWDLNVLGGLLFSRVGEFFVHCYGVKMRGGYMRFQAQYLRRIRVPSPDTLDKKIQKQLASAFVAQDLELATRSALTAYDISEIPD
jgi:adenine-specific DNA-methyltransferase